MKLALSIVQSPALIGLLAKSSCLHKHGSTASVSRPRLNDQTDVNTS